MHWTTSCGSAHPELASHKPRCGLKPRWGITGVEGPFCQGASQQVGQQQGRAHELGGGRRQAGAGRQVCKASV